MSIEVTASIIECNPNVLKLNERNWCAVGEKLPSCDVVRNTESAKMAISNWIMAW